MMDMCSLNRRLKVSSLYSGQVNLVNKNVSTLIAVIRTANRNLVSGKFYLIAKVRKNIKYSIFDCPVYFDDLCYIQ